MSKYGYKRIEKEVLIRRKEAWWGLGGKAPEKAPFSLWRLVFSPAGMLIKAGFAPADKSIKNLHLDVFR